MSTASLILVTSLSLVLTGADASLPRGVYNVPLDAKARHNLFWSLDYDKQLVKFEAHVRLEDDQWFAVGFSDRGTHENGDYCIIYPDKFQRLRIADISTDDKCLVTVDEQQDCKNFASKRYGYMTKITFTRAFDTCNKNDYKIEEGTTHIVWAIGVTFQNKRKLCDQIQEGMVRTQLLKNTMDNPVLPPMTWSYAATAPTVRVPGVETTYWCYLVKLPQQLDQKHHIIKFEPIITRGNEGLVHHMELFHCESEDVNAILSQYSGPCEKKPKELEVCKKVLAAWAMGATPFYYPEEAGLLVGGRDYSKYAMLEVHYNNPSLKADWVDNSGLRIFLTRNLRKYNAGVIELGLEYIDKMAIPPQQDEFTLSGYCIAECTAVALPQVGIMIFASQLHTHLTGVKVETSHIRNGVELPKINYDYHYSTHFQEIRLLKQQHHILPGDALVTTCTYNTVDRSNITLGGFSITDEMCVNYIYYYPKINLEVCKSSISDFALKEYFDNLNRLEWQNTGSELPISKSYVGIEWNPLRSKILHRLYLESPIYMQCNQSNGERFPGDWANMPTTTVRTALPIKESQCFHKENYVMF
ncbi:dopamine beta-hydroxylase [Cimex lectularius]|uniref:DOMON domain-containing protein n=1 Tax=Cimex lectularius TaxID=79782 RepID=A0A8I6RZX2_CIMLE|nr:dopamine beta-hydroxylase [Cimex lectularius]